jgi:hypothetical protein
MANQQLSTNTFAVEKWIVSPTASDGTHTTIGAALASASSGDTILIRPGQYTENLTLKAGVNLTAYSADGDIPNVTIVGKCTATFTGTACISGIRLQTNSDFLLAVTGGNNTNVNLFRCYLNCTNNTGISFTSSGNSNVIVFYCSGDTGTTGISLGTSTAGGALNFSYGNYTNTGNSTTPVTTSTGTVYFRYCTCGCVFTTSSAGKLDLRWNIIDTAASNTIAITTAGTGGGTVLHNSISCGSAACISVGAGTTVSAFSNLVTSSATNVFTGAGTIKTASNACNGTGSGDNVVTITPLTLI